MTASEPLYNKITEQDIFYCTFLISLCFRGYVQKFLLKLFLWKRFSQLIFWHEATVMKGPSYE